MKNSLSQNLRLEFKRAQRYQRNLVLIILRIEENDAYPRADEGLIGIISAAIEATVRFEIDFAGRTEEGEFYVILPETDIDGGIAVAERMREQIADIHQAKEGRHLGSSVGVAHYNGDRGNFESSEDFHKTAIAAKEAAIAHGGDQYWALDTPSDEQSNHQSA